MTPAWPLRSAKLDVGHASARRCVGLLCAAMLTTHAWAQTSPAFGPAAPTPPAASDAMPLDDYLALLRQAAPAAEDAAKTYLAALRLRCGGSPGVAELRRAMAREGGDPVLQGLMRAAQAQDAVARRRLVAQVPCAAGGPR